MVNKRNILHSLVFRIQARDVEQLGRDIDSEDGARRNDGGGRGGHSDSAGPTGQVEDVLARGDRGMVDEVCGVGNVEGGIVAGGPRSGKILGFFGFCRHGREVECRGETE